MICCTELILCLFSHFLKLSGSRFNKLVWSHIFQLLLEDPEVFSGQMRFKISSVCCESAPGSPHSWMHPGAWTRSRPSNRRVSGSFQATRTSSTSVPTPETLKVVHHVTVVILWGVNLTLHSYFIKDVLDFCIKISINTFPGLLLIRCIISCWNKPL